MSEIDAEKQIKVVLFFGKNKKRKIKVAARNIISPLRVHQNKPSLCRSSSASSVARTEPPMSKKGYNRYDTIRYNRLQYDTMQCSAIDRIRHDTTLLSAIDWNEFHFLRQLCWGNTKKTSTAMTLEHSTAILHWQQTDCGLANWLTCEWIFQLVALERTLTLLLGGGSRCSSFRTGERSAGLQ